ncbi:hypothetical protein EC849_107134 [Pseudomonas putida]|uniref:hypothetical protein n=1 Tax=Pseudomonas putida TaxID=303 RepID=UPI001050B888|nr:hypothetical protein [Pseudomonas putida]TCP75871.1 hypothetical protein EC849_107134 [Pseudomonas putida]
MRQVFISDDTEMEVDELLDLIRAYRIVVLNSFMRVQARNMQKAATNARSKGLASGPAVQMFEFEVHVDAMPWSLPTYMFAEDITLRLEQLHAHVERAFRVWLERGQSNHFLYTNTTIDDED